MYLMIERVVRWDLRIPYKWKFKRTSKGYVVFLGGLCEESHSLIDGTIKLITRQLNMKKHRL